MHIALLYGITSDRIRTKVADTCMDYGLDRTQFSAFIGDLSRNHQEELMLKLSSLLGDQPGFLLLMTVDWDRRVEVRNPGTDTPSTSVSNNDSPPPIIEISEEYPF